MTFVSVLTFLRITDEDGSISATNILLFVVIARIAFSHDLTGLDLGGLFLALASKAHKRQLSHASAAKAAETVTAAHVAKLDALRATTEALTSKIDKVEKTQAQQEGIKSFQQRANSVR